MKIRRPFKLPGRNGWYIDIGRKRRSLQTTDPAEAIKLYNEICRRIAQDQATPPELLGDATSLTVSGFAKRYLAWAKPVRPAATYRAEDFCLKKLKDHTDDARIITLTPEHLDTLASSVVATGRSPNTANHLIRHLKAIFQKAESWKLVAQNPFRKVKLVVVDRTPPVRLAPEDFAKLLSAITDKDVAELVRAYLATGRRRNELVNLDWADIDLNGGRYFIRKSKDHLSRWYPIPKAFRAILEAKQTRVGPVFKWQSPDAVTHVVKAALRSAGFGHLHLHSLRHSFGSAYVEANGDVRTLMDLLGHRQISTTQIYSKPSEKHLAKEIERVALPPSGA